MIKYAPLIDEETVPAFYDDTLTIQIKNNPAVDPNKVGGFKTIIKDFINGRIVGSASRTEGLTVDLIKKGLIFFGAKQNGADQNFVNKLTPGNFYKFQVCYLEKDTTTESPYSYTTIGRYLGNNQEVPKISVEVAYTADNYQKFTGSDLKNNDSLGEKIYQYRFDLKDRAGNIVDTSEWQFYINTIPTFTTYYNYTSNNYYSISYLVKTYNGYETQNTKTFQANGIEVVNNFDLKTNQNDTKSIENGYVNIEIENKPGTSLDGYEILRKIITDDSWERIYAFTDNANSKAIVRDNTVIQGIPYEYACCNPTGRLIAPSATSIPIIPKFDHMFLSDGERQLCIRFNPKVNTYKQTILEQKIDTIDGTYPVILRNGQVNYKEINISGLISFHMDNNFFFWNKENVIDKLFLQDSNMFTTNLSYENFAIEREFRHEVVEWLTNGEAKLFRSPAEGNIIVRLMDVSITPNEQLGRMIYTFSATGYEIEDIKNGIEKYITKSLQI